MEVTTVGLLQVPPPKRKLPVEEDAQELLIELLIDMTYANKDDTFAQATADLELRAIYYFSGVENTR